MKEFRATIESGDLDRLAELFAEDVVLRSPVAFKPYEGRAIVAAIIRGVSRVFTDFRYVQELTDDVPHSQSSREVPPGHGSVLVFEAFVDGVSANGIDLIRTDEEGLISELTVMVRPLSAANALAQAMAAQFPQIQAEAMAALGNHISAGETR